MLVALVFSGHCIVQIIGKLCLPKGELRSLTVELSRQKRKAHIQGILPLRSGDGGDRSPI